MNLNYSHLYERGENSVLVLLFVQRNFSFGGREGVHEQFNDTEASNELCMV